MFIFRITTDGYGMAHQMIRVRRDDNIEQLLDIYIDGPPPLSRNWLVIIPNSLILDRPENWHNIRDMVQQLPLYPLVQQELNSIARRIIVVEEIPAAIQHWYRLHGNSPRYGNFRITSSYVRIS
ncbi:hypothetical protein DERF_010126 [Dermatophagoides farinae]|uniref:Uncharacterized protein n=1 Tax=Dermatophagoides farinae TaxID=6954 RepID=A0A922HYP0_DERFA|nr:uncharacterized protein LOC124499440 [Dermatophagoides farinae]KAH9511684.1 hypothetical protein DERF_010126 [Dermatophagoides farinae]